MHGQRKLLLDLLSEGCHFLGLNTGLSAHAERIANDDFAHLIFASHFAQLRVIVAAIATVQSGKSLRRQAERVRDCDPDAPRTDVEPEDAASCLILLRRHAAIIGALGILPARRTDAVSSKPLWPKGSGQQERKGPTPVPDDIAAETAAELEGLGEGVQEVHEELRRSTITQIVLTILAVLAVCYFAKLVLVTIFTSILIAYILEPLVGLMSKIRIPRTLGSGIAVLLVLALLYGLSYFFYQRAVDFAHQLPRMQSEIKKVVGKYQKGAEQIRQSTQGVMPGGGDKNAVPVKVQQGGGIGGLIGGSEIANIGEVLLTIAFIPFIVYFMLTWEEHMRRSTVRLFPPEKRLKAYSTMGKISEMMKGFIVGNFVIGIFMAIASAIVFGFLHLPYFYFLGLISGFLSLIPYLGIVLALLPPVASGLGVLHGSGIIVIALVILGLHVFSMNVLYPKVIGGRLELNPLAVTLGLLIWGWIWGAMGLILAVPVLGAIKIVCDNIEGLGPFGRLLGEGLDGKKRQPKTS